MMRRAYAILLLVGARAAGVAPAETLSSAVPAEKKNPIDAVEITYGRVKRRWREYLRPKPKAADAPAEKSNAKPTEEPAQEQRSLHCPRGSRLRLAREAPSLFPCDHRTTLNT